MKEYFLKPSAGTQKSFNNKALVKEENANTAILISYNTTVCKIQNNKLVRLWNDYSATTLRHINAFCTAYNLPTMTKKQWENLPVKEAWNNDIKRVHNKIQARNNTVNTQEASCKHW